MCSKGQKLFAVCRRQVHFRLHRSESHYEEGQVFLKGGSCVGGGDHELSQEFAHTSDSWKRKLTKVVCGFQKIVAAILSEGAVLTGYLSLDESRQVVIL